MPWSRRARRDFDERAEYRKKNDEEDRYEKRDEKAEGGEESGSEWRRMDKEKFENLLIQIRNAGPDDEVDSQIDEMRNEYDRIESEFRRYDEDYDSLWDEAERLRRENRRALTRQSGTIKEQQNEDIKEDGEKKDFDDLWKGREG